MTDRKREILQIAQELFKENGYEATSMRDIAKAAGLEAASLYSHFDSKDELLELTCFSIAEKFVNGIKEVNDIYFDAAQKLKMAVDTHVQILTSHPTSIWGSICVVKFYIFKRYIVQSYTIKSWQHTPSGGPTRRCTS